MLSKLWPARTQAQDIGPISDLDAIVADPIPFKFKGKVHWLKPIALEDFLRFSNAQAEILRAAHSETKMSVDELAFKYHRIFSSVCDTITVDDVKCMAQVQIAALYQLIQDMFMGQVDLGDGKKKRQKIPIYDIARASSWQNAPANSDGQQT